MAKKRSQTSSHSKASTGAGKEADAAKKPVKRPAAAGPAAKKKAAPAAKTVGKKPSSAKGVKRGAAEAAAAGEILAWEDDPMSGASPITRPVPDLSAGPLALTIVIPAPPPKAYPIDSPQFRYWAAAEAARRGADFWGAILPSGTNWHPGGALNLRLDEGVELNAYYDRTGLLFFHDTVAGKTVYSGESPDIVCHELGHAVLDAFRPELWDAGFDEAAAFHESFGDMSALLSALQLPSLRQAVLTETGGRLSRCSRLSRLAEQLGWAIRQVRPDAVDPDCLRNAVNTLFYHAPTTLPPSGPMPSLSSESHSFSRVFTGAFFEALAGMLAVQAPSNPREDDLLQVSQDTGRLLVQAILAASVVPDYYSQVAAALIVAGEKDPFKGKYRDALKGAFIRHGILSLEAASARSPAAGAGAAQSRGGIAIAAAAAAPVTSAQRVQLSGMKYGLGASALLVQAPEVPRHFLVSAAALGPGSASPTPHLNAVDDFVTDLFRRGRVDLAEHGDFDSRVAQPRSRKTHKLQKEGEQLALVRTRFDCGFGHVANF